MNDSQTEIIKEADSSTLTYLIFTIGDENYAVEVSCVREIIPAGESTEIPGTPEWVEGVINLRGRIVPVVNARIKLGFSSEDCSLSKSIVVVDLSGSAIGILCDNVEDVLTVKETQIKEIPDFGERKDTGNFAGVIEINKKTVVLLDMQEFLNGGKLLSRRP